LLYRDNTWWHLRTLTAQAINWYVAVLDWGTNNTWTICIANGITTWKWGNAPSQVIYEDITNPAKVTITTGWKRIWVVKWAVGWISLQYEWDSFFIDCFDNNAWDANNGLSVSNWTTVFGQDLNEAWDPAKLLSTREVPMDWHNIELEASNGWRTISNGANGDFQVWWRAITATDGYGRVNNVHINLALWGWALYLHHNNDVYKNPWDGEYAQIFGYNSDLDWLWTYSKISWVNRSYFSQDYKNNKTFLAQVTFGWIPVVNTWDIDTLWINKTSGEIVRTAINTSYRIQSVPVSSFINLTRDVAADVGWYSYWSATSNGTIVNPPFAAPAWYEWRIKGKVSESMWYSGLNSADEVSVYYIIQNTATWYVQESW